MWTSLADLGSSAITPVASTRKGALGGRKVGYIDFRQFRPSTNGAVHHHPATERKEMQHSSIHAPLLAGPSRQQGLQGRQAYFSSKMA